MKIDDILEEHKPNALAQWAGFVVGFFLTAAFFKWANNVTFCRTILEKIGIADLTYWQYWLGAFVSHLCIAGLLPAYNNRR